MLKGYDKNGNLKNVILNNDGSIPVNMGSEISVELDTTKTMPVNIQNTSVPVNVGNAQLPVNVQNSTAIPVNVSNNSDIGVSVNNVNAIPVNVENSNNIPVSVNNNTAIPVNFSNTNIGVTQTSDTEKVLNCSIQTLSTTATSISINAKVTNIMIANYSEEADVTITIGSTNYQVGASVAVELPINANVTNISLVSTAADTKVQFVVKGVEVV